MAGEFATDPKTAAELDAQKKAAAQVAAQDNTADTAARSTEAVGEAPAGYEEEYDPFAAAKAGAQWAPGFQGNGTAYTQDAADARGLNAAGAQAREFPFPQGPQGKVSGGHYAEPYGGWGLVGDVRRANRKMGETEEQLGAQRFAQANEEAAIQQSHLAQQQQMLAAEVQQRANERKEAEARLQALQKQADEISKTKIETGRIFHSPAGVIGAIAASFMPLFTRNPDDGIRLINQAISRDIDVQSRNLDTKQKSLQTNRGLYQDYLNLVKDDQLARAMTEARLKDIAATKLMEVGARYKGPEALAAAQKNAAILKRESSILMMDIFSKLWREPKMQTEAMRIFFGKDMQRPFQGGNPQDMYETSGGAVLEGVTAEPTGWNLDKSEGGYYQDDVDYIRNAGKPGQEDRIQMVTPSEKNFVPEVEVQRFDDGELPKDMKAAGTSARKELGNRVVTAIEAADRIQKSKNKKYADFYQDKNVADDLEEYKWIYISGQIRAGKTPQKAYGEWLKEVEKAEGEGLAKIANASEKGVVGDHIATEMNRYMDGIRATPGFDPDAITSKLNLASPNWRQQWNQMKLNLGATATPEQVQALEDLYKRYAWLKTSKGKELLGSITGPDNSRLESMMVDSPTFSQMKDLVDYMSAQSRSYMRNASKSGGRVGELMWRASHNSVSAPSPYGGRANHERKAEFKREISLPVQTIK